MEIYKYIVSTLPEDWHSGSTFSNLPDAVERAEKIGGCVTELTYRFYDAELIHQSDEWTEPLD
jgi:hypothetical protein